MAKTTPEERQRIRRAGAESFLQGVLAKVPEAARDAVKAALSADEVLDELGQGVLRQQDYSRLMNETQAEYDTRLAELKAKHGVLDTWWLQNQSVVQNAVATQRELEALKSGRTTGDPADPNPDPALSARPVPRDAAMPTTPAGVSREEAQRLAGELEAGYITLSTMLTDLAFAHREEFGKPLNSKDLVAYAQDHNLRLDVAYDKYVAEARELKRTADLDTRIKQAREEGALEERQRLAAIPYPNPGNSNEPNIFAALTPGEKKPATVADIAAELRGMVAANR